jgi:hypothetical protein
MRYKHETLTKMILRDGFIFFLIISALCIWVMEPAEIIDYCVQVKRPQNGALSRGFSLAKVWTQ